jgi:hypothetical protein
VSSPNQDLSKFEPKAGLGYDSGYDPCTSACGYYAECASSALFQSIEDISNSKVRFLLTDHLHNGSEKRNANGDNNGPHGCLHGRGPRSQEENDRKQGDHEVAFMEDQVFGFGQFLPLHTS